MNRTTSRLLRAWLLLLLAVLLPLRGAVAAALPCPLPGGSPVAVAMAHGPHAAAAGGQGGAMDHQGHGHEEQGHGDAAGPGQDHALPGHAPGSGHPHAAAADACNLCAASCSLTGIPARSLALPEAPPQPARFPALLVPAPSFQSGGQDRPPRTT